MSGDMVGSLVAPQAGGQRVGSPAHADDRRDRAGSVVLAGGGQSRGRISEHTTAEIGKQSENDRHGCGHTDGDNG